MGRGWWFLVGALLLFAILLRNSLLFTTGLLLLLVGLASLLWIRYCLDEVHYTRRFSNDRLFFGEETDLWIEVTNAKLLPLAWLRCEDELPAPLEVHPDSRISRWKTGRRLLSNVFSLRWYERVSRRYRITGTQRGAWTFGPVQLVSGDLFGFAQKRQRLEETQTLLVYPRMVSITALGLPARHPFGEWRTERRIVEDPMRVMGVRAYQPGDNYRSIHWKATARRQELQTKIFEPTASRPLLLFLDVNTRLSAFEGVDPALREYAITAAASIARWAWEQDETVGLYSNGLLTAGRLLRIPPSSRPDQPLRILEGLARLKLIHRVAIDRVIRAEMAGLRYGATVVVVSPVVTHLLERVLVDLVQRGYPVALVYPGARPLDRVIAGVRIYFIGEGEVLNASGRLELA